MALAVFLVFLKDVDNSVGELSEGQRLVPAAAEDILAGLSVVCLPQPTTAAEPCSERAAPGTFLQPSDVTSGTQDSCS